MSVQSSALSIKVISPGLLMSVQDLGRPEARRYGVAPGGALDPFALAAANQLVGNPPGLAGIEITAGGATLQLHRSMTIALAGADLGASLNDRPMLLWTAVRARAGAILQLTGRRGSWGARAYLAIAGGIDVPLVLGSRSTDLSGGFGGLQGHALHTGDILPVGPSSTESIALAGQHWPEHIRPHYSAQPTLRFIPGPHLECFIPGTVETLVAATFQISTTSNRMGYRLEGPRLRYSHLQSLRSLGVVPGTIQVPPDGMPILLMADAQTTGGYPIIGALISADLPLAAQLLPGDQLCLAPTSLEEAYDALRDQADALAHSPEPDEGDLLAALAGA
jgi:biotin-dependent carboxylase-like uncharacterized protein